MAEHVGLDNPIFAGRLKQYGSARSVAKPTRRVYATPRMATPSAVVSQPLPKAPEAPPAQTAGVRQAAVQPAPMLPKKAARAMSTTKPAATRRKKSKVLMRRSLRRPTYQMRAKRRRGPSISLALSALAIILFVTGLAINFSVLSKSHEAEAQVASMSNTNSGNDKPDETHPGNIKSYQVGPTMPRFIRIPKLTVEARVKRIGIKANNELQAPTNIFDTGWYDGSSKPGEGAGAALIDAHVSGPTKHGVFYDLKKLVAGDAIQIERGDGKLLNYKVVSSKSFPVDSVDMASTLVSVDPAKPGLNLMTCDGQYDSKTDQYKNRLVVYAVQQ